MSNKNMTLAEEFAFDQLALDNALSNPTILSHLAEVGHVEERLRAGRGKLTMTMNLHQQKGGEYGEQYNATDAKDAAWDAANRVYMQQVKLARIPIKQRGDRDLLKLDGDRKQKWADWRDQTEAFYTNLLKNTRLQQLLLDVNLTVAKLTAAYDLVKAVDAARAAQATEHGEAQNATDERDAALDDLRDWMGDYLAAARVALEDQPQLLEVLGIVVPSPSASHPTPADTPTMPDLPGDGG